MHSLGTGVHHHNNADSSNNNNNNYNYSTSSASNAINHHFGSSSPVAQTSSSPSFGVGAPDDAAQNMSLASGRTAPLALPFPEAPDVDELSMSPADNSRALSPSSKLLPFEEMGMDSPFGYQREPISVSPPYNG
mmetsp:Transcript_52163/g.113593  ORF Transcript_52163/g.113593 Transcript_52163/m.113593 type:complete len:134 (-) Transcript_52163:518-919(-)